MIVKIGLTKAALNCVLHQLSWGRGVGGGLIRTVIEAWMGVPTLLVWMGLLSCDPLSLSAAVISTVFVLKTPSSLKSCTA
jgi:hypothetical protein